MSENEATEASDGSSLEKEKKVDIPDDTITTSPKEETSATTEKKEMKDGQEAADDVAEYGAGLDKENAGVGAASATRSKTDKEQANPMFEELKSAFPNVEDKYIKAVLIASQGVLSPAFNALLYLSDPSFENEVQLPPHPIPPERSTAQLKQAQLQQDELLARHLDEQYNQKREAAARKHRKQHARKQQPSFVNESDEEDFIDTINRGLQETSKKVGMWWDGIKKNFAEEKERFGDPVYTPPSQNFRQRRFNSFGAHDDDVLSSRPRDNLSQNRHARYAPREEDENSDAEMPPKLPARKTTPQATEANESTADETTTEKPQPKLWQPRPSQPSRAASKVSAISTSHTPPKAHGPIKLDPDQDEFLINSDDEL